MVDGCWSPRQNVLRIESTRWVQRVAKSSQMQSGEVSVFDLALYDVIMHLNVNGNLNNVRADMSLPMIALS